ncbi:CRISPR-associated RAMP Cmr2 [Lachnospiraceae bacterium TWA4]|nr:CRISPR-associated RAMP Cmr2 [Lachnospiraceae bacterium TWA4]
MIDDNQYSKNCILRLSPYLDALELNTSCIIDQSVQPISVLFEGESDKKHNELVKEVFSDKKHKNASHIKMTKDGQLKVRNLEDIAKSVSGNMKSKKISNYYAVVQADGDSVGKYLGSLISDEKVKGFSERCLKYTQEAAELIKNFSGVVIYAGGDDLLFICPLEHNSKTIFELCKDIRDRFNDKFKGDGVNVDLTVSFGISINYYKFPLYEALEDVMDLLFGVAKDVKNKNSTALRIRKHSGQSLKICYENGGNIHKVIKDLLGSKEPNQDVLKSMLYKMSLYRSILSSALNQDKNLNDVFANLFDNINQQSYSGYIDKVANHLQDIYNHVRAFNPEELKNFALEAMFPENKQEENIQGDDTQILSPEEVSIRILCCILRIVKFYIEEKGGK